MKTFYSIVFLLVILTSYKVNTPFTTSEYLKEIRLKAINDNIIGKKYYYDFTNNKSCNKSYVCYLGTILTTKNVSYKILNSFYVLGQSCRGSSRIVIYDINNRYIGNYPVTLPDELPDTLINNILTYKVNNPECLSRKGYQISLQKGLPREIFIPCENIHTGQLYTFTNIE